MPTNSPFHMNKNLLLPLVGGLLALLGSGCGDTHGYSGAIRYTVRTDPLVLTDQLGEKEGETYPIPDPPGQLPLLSPKDIQDPRNPFHLASFVPAQGDPAKKIFDPLALFAKKLIDPTLLNASDHRKLQSALDVMFGSPAKPSVGVLEVGELDKLHLQSTTLRHGSSLYRVHCLHCHGVTGDGRGPTSRWVNPHPRDFRRGLFKFQSVDQSGGVLPPSREDLLHTLKHGVEGTAMPAFNLLPEPDLQALVSYVLHLSIRGRAEFDLLAQEFKQIPGQSLNYESKTDLQDALDVYGRKFAEAFLKAQTKKIKVGPYPIPDGDRDALKKSVHRGLALFNGEPNEQAGITKEVASKANCKSCHNDYGRKAGFRWDQWGTLVKPRNFPEVALRGGRRPVDVYYRIHGGIQGSGMNAFNNLSNEHIWDLVNFITTLPYPLMRRELGINID